MPFITIQVAGTDPTRAQRERLLREASRLAQESLGKRLPLTVATISVIAADDWAVGGTTLQPGERGAILEIITTSGTNTEAEKAEFVRRAQDLLTVTMNLTRSPVYVVVRETPATDWGYDGMTQAARAGNATVAPLP